jgi:hypothetical protein
MSQEADRSGTGKQYSMGDVGAGARVVQGDHNVWSESLGISPGGAQLAHELTALLVRIKADAALDPDDRELAADKAQAVAEALPKAAESPDTLRRALRDARQFFSAKAEWAWERLREILTSEPGLQVLAAITDTTTKAAMHALLGVTL